MSDSDSDSAWVGLFGVAVGLALVFWLLYTVVVYLYENARTIALWIGPFALVIGSWYGLRIFHRLVASHPAASAVRKRSVTDAAPLLCASDKGGLAFMHENHAKNADKLCRKVEEETAQISQQIARLEAELARLGAVHGGAPAEAIAAVQSSRHDTELRRALIRRLAEEEGMHVKE